MSPGYSPAASPPSEINSIGTTITARTGARRPDLPDVVVGLGALAAFVSLLWLGRGLTFFADEWAVMADWPISLDSFLKPFNEHWLGVTTVVYRLLLDAFGMSSYLPYLALLALIHVIVVIEVYILARRAAGLWIGALIALIVAFFGSGFENLFWAMQIGFVGAVALGLGALLAVDGQPSCGRVALATVLLTVGMMTSGIGIFMLVLVGLDLLVDPSRRRAVVALAIPAGIYLGWYLLYGHTGVANARDPFTLDAAISVPGFVIDGVGTAFGSALGVGPLLGRIAAAALLVWIAVRAVRREAIPGRALACFAAIVFEYALLGLLRAQLFDTAAEYSRYAYISGILALLGMASLAGQIKVPDGGPRRVAAVTGLIAVATLSLVWNVWLLRDGRDLFADRAARTRAMVVVIGDLGPGLDPDTTIVLDRTVTRIREVIEEFGSPLTDTLAGDSVPPVDPELVRSIRARFTAGEPVP